MQQVENYYLAQESTDVVPFFRNYINFMVIFFPLTSFLVLPSVQGTTIITVLAATQFSIFLMFPAGNNKMLYMKELLVFLVIFFVFSIISQYLNLILELKLDQNLVLVTKGGYLDYFYRSSHFTQALYLIISFIIYLFIKYYADESVIVYIYWALRLLCVYAIYEFVYYLATGNSGDFIMNRKFGDLDGSLFQVTNIGGMNFMRMKGYTGEPSMFTFTILPFWVLSYALKRKFDNILMLSCLVLSFSTTAYFSIILFNGFWFFYKKRYNQLLYVLLGMVTVLLVLQMDAFRSVTDSLYEFVFGSKLSGNSVSSKYRGGVFEYHMEYWSHLNLWHKLFGIGFGYIRSTDFFTTILVNNGLLGSLLFSLFVFKNFRIRLPNRDLSFCYFSGLIILFFIMMATVPEFAYPSLWIYLGLAYVFNKSLKSYSI